MPEVYFKVLNTDLLWCTGTPLLDLHDTNGTNQHNRHLFIYLFIYVCMRIYIYTHTHVHIHIVLVPCIGLVGSVIPLGIDWFFKC